MIEIVGLGPGSVESLTLGAVNILKSSKKVYLRTKNHPTVKYLVDQGIKFETYDSIYDFEQKFEGVYEKIAKTLVLQEKKYGNIVYAVPGHPLVAEKSVSNLIELCRQGSIEYRIVPAVSFMDALFESLQIDMAGNLKIIDAFDISPYFLDKRCKVIITQVYDRLIASEVKLKLMEYYEPDIDIYFIRAAGIKEIESVRRIKLYELDRQDDIDFLTSIYIPQNSRAGYDFVDLLQIMQTLRGDNGCPWDKEQDHESIKKCLIEEAYETVEAIEDKNFDGLVEELGDVLFQVIFHAQLGKEEALFNISDVIDGICKKMIERHPHVFGNTKIESSREVIEKWDEIKKNQQGLKTYTDELKHVAKTLPALMRADKVQRKAAKIGFDFDNKEDALSKVIEEYYELKSVYNSKQRAKIVGEVGDLIFAVVNVARFLDINPEFALNYTIEKFIKRFAYIENKAKCNNTSIQNMTIDQMNKFWEESKSKGI